MASRARRGSQEGELYNLLAERFPGLRNEDGTLHIVRLSHAVGCSHETAYKIIRGKETRGYPEGWLTPQMAVRLLDLSRKMNPGNRLYAQELLPFVIPHFDRYSDPAALLE